MAWRTNAFNMKFSQIGKLIAVVGLIHCSSHSVAAIDDSLAHTVISDTNTITCRKSEGGIKCEHQAGGRQHVGAFVLFQRTVMFFLVVMVTFVTSSEDSAKPGNESNNFTKRVVTFLKNMLCNIFVSFLLRPQGALL